MHRLISNTAYDSSNYNIISEFINNLGDYDMTQSIINYCKSTVAQRDYIKARISELIAAAQGYLVEELLKKDIFSYDDIINLYLEPHEDYEDVNEGYQEIFEWYLIDNKWFADKLIESNEPVLKNEFGTWWGRTCSGQSIELDPTFWIIFQENVKEIV
jgi:uncharacterized protein YozE (UPF0346 family)